MQEFTGVLGLVQIFFAIVIGLYFFNLLRNQQTNKAAVERESRKEMQNLEKLRNISLTEPLSEKTRPSNFKEIVGQEEGLKALRAALCTSNPQHVLLYGPPGIGKTAAARLVLEEAKRTRGTPFGEHSRFIELDATTARFDERGIADPLIGTVHDPIYQGAGAMGMAGIPQPKPGAVTRAHGGILFIDEIGELHPIQINKLLKVLEDRKVFLESSYYNSEDTNIPRHIHEMFQNGLPADFRLIGATTRTPEEMPPAVRSRCLEIFFRGLHPNEVAEIALNAAKRIKTSITDSGVEVVQRYANNGREAVNIVQMAAGITHGEGKSVIDVREVEWVVNSSQLSPRPEKSVPQAPQTGYANGLAVYGPNMGTIVEIEASVIPVNSGRGAVNINGMVEEEELGGGGGRTVKRKSTARGSVDNVISVLSTCLELDLNDYHLHLNFPGGIPLDGGSAGVGIATAIYSALKNEPVDPQVAMTGEISVRGYVRPVGGIVPKLEAAVEAGAAKVIIPEKNWQESFRQDYSVEIVPVSHLNEVLQESLCKYNNIDREKEKGTEKEEKTIPLPAGMTWSHP